MRRWRWPHPRSWGEVYAVIAGVLVVLSALVWAGCGSPLPTSTPTSTPVVDRPTITAGTAILIVLEPFHVRFRDEYHGMMTARYMGRGIWEVNVGTLYVWQVSERTGRVVPMNDNTRALEAVIRR